MGDLLDLMGQPGGRELILLSILSSSHMPLRAGRRASSSAVGTPACSCVQAGEFGSQPLGADGLLALRGPAPRNPWQHACVRLRSPRLSVLVGAFRTVRACAFGAQSGP